MNDEERSNQVLKLKFKLARLSINLLHFKLSFVLAKLWHVLLFDIVCRDEGLSGQCYNTESRSGECWGRAGDYSHKVCRQHMGNTEIIQITDNYKNIILFFHYLIILIYEPPILGIPSC